MAIETPWIGESGFSNRLPMYFDDEGNEIPPTGEEEGTEDEDSR